MELPTYPQVTTVHLFSDSIKIDIKIFTNPKLKSNIPPRLRSMNVLAKVNMQYRNKVYWHLWGQKNKYENNNLEYFMKELHR